MNPKFNLISILLLLALALAACGEAEPAVPTPASTPTSPPPAPTVPATPTPEPPTPTAEPRPLSTIAPSPELAPTLPSEASSDMAEMFLPQCDRRPPEIERPTQIHPETGESWFRYANDEYGFAFLFPPEWELLEGNNYLCLNYRANREIKLIVGYKWANDRDISIIRTGVAAGELVTTGQLDFLGQEIDRNVLRYEGKDKAILYDNAFHIRANDLFFTLSIDDFRMDYDLAELPPEVMDTADAIVESFELIDRLYVNESYGFAFTLPPEWRLRPTAFYNFDLPPSQENGLRLSYRPDLTGDTDLTIGFKWEEEEDINIMRTGTGEVDEFIEGEIEFMDRTISRVVWRYEDKTTAVFYQGASHINVNGLLFTLSLDYHDPTYTGRTLIPEAMVSADAIVQSFRLTWEAEWRTVQVDDLAFTIDIPADWHSRQHEWDIYFGSDRRFGEGEGPTAWVYSVYALEYPNPDQLPWPEALMPDLSEGIRENFTYTANTIGGQTVYITERMPSAYGALTVFYERDGRYLAIALTPYDSQNPYYPAQARHLSLFETMLESVKLISTD
jgi:hypothetical protein